MELQTQQEGLWAPSSFLWSYRVEGRKSGQTMALGTGRRRVRIHAGLLQPVSVAVQETTGRHGLLWGHLFCLLVCFIVFETGFTYGTLADLELDM